jgi:hypothetical protein
MQDRIWVKKSAVNVVDHQFLGFLFQHPDLVARPRPQP